MNKIVFSNTDKNDVADARTTLWAYIAVFYRINSCNCHISKFDDDAQYEKFYTTFYELRNSVVKGMRLNPKDKFFLKFNEWSAGSLYSTIYFDNRFQENPREVFRPHALTSIGNEAVNVMLEKLQACAEKLDDLYRVIALSDYVKERYEKTDGNIHINITDDIVNNIVVGNKKYRKTINEQATVTVKECWRKFSVSKESLCRIVIGDTIDFSFVDKELINLLPEIESALKYIEFKDVRPFQIEQKDYVSDALPLYN